MARVFIGMIRVWKLYSRMHFLWRACRQLFVYLSSLRLFLSQFTTFHGALFHDASLKSMTYVNLRSFNFFAQICIHDCKWFIESRNKSITIMIKIRNKCYFVTKALEKFYLVPHLCWPTVRKKCSSDWEKLLKFSAFSLEFAKFLRSLEQLI